MSSSNFDGTNSPNSQQNGVSNLLQQLLNAAATAGPAPAPGNNVPFGMNPNMVSALAQQLMTQMQGQHTNTNMLNQGNANQLPFQLPKSQENTQQQQPQQQQQQQNGAPAPFQNLNSQVALLAASGFNPALLFGNMQSNAAALQAFATLMHQQTQNSNQQPMPVGNIDQDQRLPQQPVTTANQMPVNGNSAHVASPNPANRTFHPPQNPSTLPNQNDMNLNPKLATKRSSPPLLKSNKPLIPPSNSSTYPGVLPQMHSWKLEQLEAHLKALEQAKQPIPHSLSVLVADAKRKEEKRTAKRVANRKSACASRERKKALVEDMTRMNKLLKREAMILSLLPDLVIAVTTAGKITFCSGQVERVLRHKTSDLLGANISQIIVPSSREALTCLIHKLIAAQLAAMDNCNKEAEADDNESYSNSGGNTSDNHIVSEQSEQGFPLSVVSVKNRANVSNETDPESFNDTKESTSKSSRTLKSASSGQSGDNQGSTSPKNSGTEYAENQTSSSSDFGMSSDDVKNLKKANEALSQNVRDHNEKLLSQNGDVTISCIHKDDVIGEFVTANNADARLSSLQHIPEKDDMVPKGKLRSESENGEDGVSEASSDSLLDGVEENKSKIPKKSKAPVDNSSDDSGYRESGSTPCGEDSSESVNSNSEVRKGPLAPACHICLIRDDLSTIWCEVTSSIYSRPIAEESDVPLKDPVPVSKETDTQELLLCLRPIRDGKDKVEEALRFQPSTVVSNEDSEKSNDSDGNVASIDVKSNPSGIHRSRLLKKRPIVCVKSEDVTEDGPESKKLLKTSNNADAEKSVAEYLMLMSTNKAI